MQTNVAVVGSTGTEGSGLAPRFAHAGVRVRTGLRNLERAQDTARPIAGQTNAAEVTGHTNGDDVAASSIVIPIISLSAQVDTPKSIRGSFAPGAIPMDAIVPLEVAIGGRFSRTLTLWDGSAGQQAARPVPAVPVVAAFHALSAEALAKLDHPLDGDTLIWGDSPKAKAAVARLAAMIPGVRAIDAGPLDDERLLESAAALLISLNLRHKVKESGIRIAGLPGGADS